MYSVMPYKIVKESKYETTPIIKKKHAKVLVAAGGKRSISQSLLSHLPIRVHSLDLISAPSVGHIHRLPDKFVAPNLGQDDGPEKPVYSASKKNTDADNAMEPIW